MQPGQLGRFDDQKVQYADALGRWMWIAYRAIETLEFKDQPLSPAGTVDLSAARRQPPDLSRGDLQRPRAARALMPFMLFKPPGQFSTRHGVTPGKVFQGVRQENGAFLPGSFGKQCSTASALL